MFLWPPAFYEKKNLQYKSRESTILQNSVGKRPTVDVVLNLHRGPAVTVLVAEQGLLGTARQVWTSRVRVTCIINPHGGFSCVHACFTSAKSRVCSEMSLVSGETPNYWFCIENSISRYDFTWKTVGFTWFQDFAFFLRNGAEWMHTAHNSFLLSGEQKAAFITLLVSSLLCTMVSNSLVTRCKLWRK